MVPLDLRTLRILLAPLVLRGSPSLPLLLQVEEGEGGGFSGGPGVPAVSEGGFRMFVAGRMVLRLFLESHGTLSHLVAVSAPLVMPLRDSDIPMNVPFTFRNKQPFPHGKRSYTLRTGRTLALAPFLTVTVNAG
jgi:hypothetical protein